MYNLHEIKKQRAKQQRIKGNIRKALKEQKVFYSRFDRPIKSRYTHYISKDDFKTIKKTNATYYTKRNELIRIKR